MNRAIGCLAGVLVLALWPGAAVAQSGAWETTMAAGMSAHQGGHYAEAEEKFSAALKEAEAFGPEDPRLAAGLNNLASPDARREPERAGGAPPRSCPSRRGGPACEPRAGVCRERPGAEAARRGDEPQQP